MIIILFFFFAIFKKEIERTKYVREIFRFFLFFITIIQFDCCVKSVVIIYLKKKKKNVSMLTSLRNKTRKHSTIEQNNNPIVNVRLSLLLHLFKRHNLFIKNMRIGGTGCKGTIRKRWGRQDIIGSNKSLVYRIVNTNKTQYFLQVTKE